MADLTNLTPAQRRAAEHGLLVLPVEPKPKPFMGQMSAGWEIDQPITDNRPDYYALSQENQLRKRLVEDCPLQPGEDYPFGGKVASVEAFQRKAIGDSEVCPKTAYGSSGEALVDLGIAVGGFDVGTWLWLIRKERVRQAARGKDAGSSQSQR